MTEPSKPAEAPTTEALAEQMRACQGDTAALGDLYESVCCLPFGAQRWDAADSIINGRI